MWSEMLDMMRLPNAPDINVNNMRILMLQRLEVERREFNAIQTWCYINGTARFHGQETDAGAPSSKKSSVESRMIFLP